MLLKFIDWRECRVSFEFVESKMLGPRPIPVDSVLAVQRLYPQQKIIERKLTNSADVIVNAVHCVFFAVFAIITGFYWLSSEAGLFIHHLMVRSFTNEQ